ncbi:trigger factor [Chloroflexota bacterium]
MKVSTEKIEGSRVLLNIEIESEEMEKSLHEAYQRLVTKTVVPGFRRGKAPRPMLERYLGKEALVDDAINHLIPKTYDQTIRDHEIQAIDQPEIEVIQTDPVIYKATIPVQPTVEIKDYHQIRVSPEEIIVDEGEITEGIEKIREFQATWEPVERAAIFDDLLSMDVQGSVDNKTLFDEKGVQYQLIANSTAPASGFAEALEGTQKEEDRVFSLTLPAQYGEFSGKECEFKVKVTEIKQKKLPPLDDDFAKGLGHDIETLDALNEKVADDIRAAKEREQRAKLTEEVIDAVVALAQLELPDAMIEHELEHLIANRGQHFGNKEQFDEYMKTIGKTEEEFKNELRPMAEKNVTQSLVVKEIAKLEKIEANAAEVDAEAERLIQSADQRGEELRQLLSSPDARNSLMSNLYTKKTIDYLVEMALGHKDLTLPSNEETGEENKDATE